MKRYRVTLEGHTFDVKVLDDPRREQVQVEVNGETFVVGVETVPVVVEGTIGEAAPASEPSPARSMPTPGGAATAGVSQTVTAPLPGVIKSIAVRPGQQVTPNDELFVIEAMKMDNVIRAQRAGTIGTIYVTEGRQVAYGEAMLDFVD
jgi:oxaloacetate decarboxylase alpha subunit